MKKKHTVQNIFPVPVILLLLLLGAVSLSNLGTACARELPLLAGSINGCCYNDRNQNGVQDDNEEGLSGLQIFLERIYFPQTPATTETDHLGMFEFSGLKKGFYKLGVSADHIGTVTIENPALIKIGFLRNSYNVNFGILPVSVSIDAVPQTIQRGDSTLLSWSSKNAETVTIDQDIGEVAAEGVIEVTPLETITYTVTAIGETQAVSSDNITIVVTEPPPPPPEDPEEYEQPQVAITADPASIGSGQSSTLSWSSKYADTAVLDPDIGSVDLNSTIEVSPDEDTTYKITVTGPGGTATDSVFIDVTSSGGGSGGGGSSGGGNGGSSTSTTTSVPAYSFHIRAKADLFEGVGPEMVLEVDGEIKGTVFVNTSFPETYAFQVPPTEVPADNFELGIGFYNDAYNSEPLEDRNLYVDKTTITWSPVSFDVIEAEDMSHHDNGIQDGVYWKLWSNGKMTENIEFSETTSTSTSTTTIFNQDAIIIDHTCTDINQVPDSYIQQAKSLFKISYGHTSHGSQIITGMNVLMSQDSENLYTWNHDGTGGALSLHDSVPNGDLGNPDRTTWADRTRDLLDAAGNDRNMIMWAWCGQVSDADQQDINTYLTLMDQLEDDYPDVTFIYMTGHLDGSGENGNLHIRNNQIRNFCVANDKILFDFADIESYNPDGDYFLDRGADDRCYYDGNTGNWAIEWCNDNPGSDLCAACDCAHSRSLNCNLKARAFWWMLARIAGWNGL